MTAVAAGTLIVGVAAGVSIGYATKGPSSPSSTASPASNPGGSTASAARSLYQQVLAAARASAGCHYVSDSSGVANQRIVGDAGSHGGTQLITLESNYGSEQFTLVLAGGIVYFQGNTPALQDQLGVPATSAPGLQGRWISVKGTDGPYGVIAPGITVADQAKQLTLVPTSTFQVTTGGGVKATRIGGTVPPQSGAPAGKGHLDIAAGSRLPISYVTTVSISGVTLSTVTSFSAWGTASAPAAPSGAVAWSTLGASPPPNGYGNGGGVGATPAPTPGI